MALKSVGFTIKIPVAKETTQSQKYLDKQRKTLVDMQTKDLPKLTRATKDYLKSAKDGFKETGDASEKMGKSFSQSMNDGLRGLNKFTTGLEKAKSKLLNMKTAIAGTVIGGAAFMAGRKIYEEGKQQAATRSRVNREFGANAPLVFDVAGKMSKRAGIQDDEAARALIPLMEALEPIEAGAQFRGMKSKLTAKGAEALRKKNLNFGAELIGRLSLMAPDMAPEEVGKIAGDALAGPEGIRTLISAFSLSKHSKKLATLNEQGKAFQGLSVSERDKLGITKQGQYLEQGDLVRLIMERSGISTQAAEAKRGKLDFNIKAIGNIASDALGDIGSAALEKFNLKLKDGETIADRFRSYIDDNQETIKKFGEGLASAAEGLAGMAKYVPTIGAFLSEHKASLITLGAAYYGLKGMSALGGKLGGKEGGGGLLGTVGNALGMGKPTPVFVTNPGFGGGPGGIPGMGGGGPGGLLAKGNILGTLSAVASAGALGYSIGTFIDESTGASDKISKWASGKANQGKYDEGTKRFADSLAASNAQKSERVKQFEAQGIAHGMAVFMAEHPESKQPIQLQVNLDGKVVAQVVTNHQARGIKTLTANGAAPNSRE